MKRLAILFSCLVLAGCGSKRGNQTNPLTSDQKIAFAGTLESVGRSQKAGDQARKDGQRAAPAPSDATLQKMADQIAAGNCDYVLPKASEPSSDPMNTTTEAGMSVSGASCPIALNFNFKVSTAMSKTAFSYKQDFVLKYDVKNKDFAALNDVTAIDLKGSGSSDFASGSANGKIDIEGSVTSTSQGALKMYVSGKIDGSGNESAFQLNSEIVWGVEYPTFTAELKKVEKQDAQKSSTEYYLNGQSVTAEEFQALLEKAGSIGQVSVKGKA